MSAQFDCKMPPAGTSCGYRTKDGSMWVACAPEGKPGIAYCEHPGNWLNPVLWSLVAVFEKEEDRDFVLKLHRQAVVIYPRCKSCRGMFITEFSRAYWPKDFKPEGPDDVPEGFCSGICGAEGETGPAGPDEDVVTSEALAAAMGEIPATDSDAVLMPRALIAENGAKALLSGEFYEEIEVANPDFDPDCDDPDNEDYDEETAEPAFVTEKVMVTWTTIKKIYARCVEHFTQANPDGNQV